jgi:adenine-specific DNA-methyltransferase
MFGDEYLLRYMLKWESRKSETLLDVEKLHSPFSYKLRLHRDGETREQPVDLPETFNYLIGLDVETRRVYRFTQRHEDTESHLRDSASPREENLRDSVSPRETSYITYRGTTRDGRRAAVIWRETQGWTEEDYKRDAAFVAEQKMTEGVEEVFVNGDSFIPGARSLDGVFKARLFG